MGFIWIAAYPKAGSTWLRFLLASYFVGPITGSMQVQESVPELDPNRDMRLKLRERDPLCIKTHYPWAWDHPYAALTDKAIVIVRYPKDVLLSNLNYHRLAYGHDNGFTDAEYARAFIAAGGDPVWLTKRGFGTLEGHIASWLDNPAAPPRLLIKYEDLARDAEGELTRILGFIGVTPDQAQVRRAAAESRFENMRRIEETEKAQEGSATMFPGVRPHNGWSRYFVNKGQSWSTLAHLGEDLDRRFEDRFGPLMRRLGYASQTKEAGESLKFADGWLSSGPSSPRFGGLSRSG